MVQGWRDRTPDGFGFSLKVPQVITHEKVLVDCRAEVRSFLTAARELGPKLLCCVLQFGYFNQKQLPGLGAFLERLEPFLAAWPEDVPVGVEVRNKGWVTPPLAECLRRHRAVWVLTDQSWMPSPLAVLRKVDPVTGPFAYVRLLGDRQAVDALTPTLDRVVIDRTAQLRDDAEAVRQLRERVPVLVFVNNHDAGYAPGHHRPAAAPAGVRTPGHRRVPGGRGSLRPRPHDFRSTRSSARHPPGGRARPPAVPERRGEPDEYTVGRGEGGGRRPNAGGGPPLGSVGAVTRRRGRRGSARSPGAGPARRRAAS
jgi:uncharacterized protein YecE (DUF72 family)